MTSSIQQAGVGLEVGARLEASLPDSFPGDTLLPGQYYDILGRRRWQDGEYRLAFAVLADAIACYYKHKGAKSRKGRLLFEEVRLWMHSRSRNGVFAFRNLCEFSGSTRTRSSTPWKKDGPPANRRYARFAFGAANRGAA